MGDTRTQRLNDAISDLTNAVEASADDVVPAATAAVEALRTFLEAAGIGMTFTLAAPVKLKITTKIGRDGATAVSTVTKTNVGGSHQTVSVDQ
jgi:hypothetical protein